MVLNYEKERAKLYAVLYGRELDPEYNDEEPKADYNAANMTGTALEAAQGLYLSLIPVVLILCVFAYVVTAPARFADWFERGGIEIKKFEYPRVKDG